MKDGRLLYKFLRGKILVVTSAAVWGLTGCSITGIRLTPKSSSVGLYDQTSKEKTRTYEARMDEARTDEITGGDDVIDEEDCEWFQKDTSGFVHPSQAEKSFLYGTWEAYTSDWTEESLEDIGAVQWSPYLIFCKDGTLVYQFGSELIKGTYRVNPENDAFCAVGDLDGREVKISVNQMYMDVTNMQMVEEKALETFKTTVWGFTKWSESEDYGVDSWME